MFVKVRKNSRPFWKSKILPAGEILEVPDKPFKDKPAKWMIPCDSKGATTDEKERELERQEGLDEEQREAERVEQELRAKITAEVLEEMEVAKPKKKAVL